jgi:SAM-dependent methyltransferase
MGSAVSKRQVYEFWNRAPCGEELYLAGLDRAAYERQARRRYELEPYIPEFARFEEARGLRVLEIGVGLGADHQRFAEAGAELYGIDLTPRAMEHTRRRLMLFGLRSKLAVADAEALPFRDEAFDLVYAWGVLHHTPDTPKAVAEVWRVLKPDGCARIMLYHKWSLVGLMLWTRYALLALRPWWSLRQVYARYLESPEQKRIQWQRPASSSPPSAMSTLASCSRMATCWHRTSDSGIAGCSFRPPGGSGRAGSSSVSATAWGSFS